MPHDAVAGVLAAPGFTRATRPSMGSSCFIQRKNMKKPSTLAGNMRNKSGNYIRSLDGGFVGRWTALDMSLGYFKDF